MSSNFDFLAAEWGSFYKSAVEAELSVNTAPRLCVFSCRYNLEQVVGWLYNNDSDLIRPYRDNLASLIHEQTFKDILPPSLFGSVHFLWQSGNTASHGDNKTISISKRTALVALKHLHLFLTWFARIYSENQPDVPPFDETLIPDSGREERTVQQLSEMQKKLEQTLAELKIKAEENDDLKIRIANLKVLNSQRVSPVDFRPDEATETETRNVLIDMLLHEAGWKLDQERDREFEVTGMPNNQGTGFVDYVLWGSDGLPLAVVEAKRTTKDPGSGQHQAKLYADCLERMTGQRPIIFYTNGYETYIWDDMRYPPRHAAGFYTKEELQRTINRRNTYSDLRTKSPDTSIVNRYYQKEAIRRVSESFQSKSREALLVMATGTGKTRTAIALVELLMRANWVKRVLFLADRNALVTQAKNAFTAHLPNVSTVDLTKDKETTGTRIVFSTYPTMMNSINGFNTGHFDLIIIDEAHRSIYMKYQAIFEYFDSLLIGLTATPKDEVDKNTYKMFGLENGVPTYAYELDQAVKDGFLVPYKAISVPIKFPREGIKYADLSEDEKEEYEEKFYDDDSESLPEWIESPKLNTWVFNEDTVDKVLTFLMEHGQKVEGGDKLGKTIIFAKNHKHADFIRQRFDNLFPQFKGDFLQVIDNTINYAQDRIENFGVKTKNPVIAVSVDMLDTGIDIPEILNLVFFKIVRSSSKFWQMIGRGTRLCENLFEPGVHKEFFTIFDFCENFEFFDQNPEGYTSKNTVSITEKIFTRRLRLSQVLRSGDYMDDEQHNSFRISLLDCLHKEVADIQATRLDTLIVRPHRRYVDIYSLRDKWDNLSQIDITDIEEHLAPLSIPEGTDELARRFDLLILNLQLSLVENIPQQQKYINNVMSVADYLYNKKMNVPSVHRQKEIISQVTTDEFWQDVTITGLEQVRIAMRDLIKFIDKSEKVPVYTDFKDEIMEVKESPGISFGTVNISNYRKKVETYIRQHEDHITIHKLKYNETVTSVDIKELEKIIFAGDLGSREDFIKAYGTENPLGRFIRSIVGLDRNAAKEAFSDFLEKRRLSADQMTFIDQIIDYLTQDGILDAGKLMEVPFTDIHYDGVMGVFSVEEAEELKEIIEKINAKADVG